MIDCATGAGKIDDFGTVRGRVGYVFDNLLVFGSGGFAWAHETATVTETCNGAKVSQNVGCARNQQRLVFRNARRLGGRGRI